MKIRIHNPVYGVPITFLDKYCPDQFEIIDKLHSPFLNKKEKYSRFLIRKS